MASAKRVGGVVGLSDLIRSANVLSGTVSSAILQKAVEQQNAAKEVTAVAVVGKLLTQFEAVVKDRVSTLQIARKAEKLAKKAVDDANRAWQYFGETGNPLPFYAATSKKHQAVGFCVELGIAVPADDDDAWTIPSDWTPAETI